MQRSQDALGLKRTLFQPLAPILQTLEAHLPQSPACQIHIFYNMPTPGNCRVDHFVINLSSEYKTCTWYATLCTSTLS